MRYNTFLAHELGKMASSFSFLFTFSSNLITGIAISILHQSILGGIATTKLRLQEYVKQLKCFAVGKFSLDENMKISLEAKLNSLRAKLEVLKAFLYLVERALVTDNH